MLDQTYPQVMWRLGGGGGGRSSYFSVLPLVVLAFLVLLGGGGGGCGGGSFFLTGDSCLVLSRGGPTYLTGGGVGQVAHDLFTGREGGGKKNRHV